MRESENKCHFRFSPLVLDRGVVPSIESVKDEDGHGVTASQFHFVLYMG